MLARDLMTKDVAMVSPDTAVDEIARLLLARGISAAPVIDAAGAAMGMVSEGDLIGRSEADREARRDWWLALLAEGEELHTDFLRTLRQPQRTARDVMTAPVVTITETTEAAEIARILKEYRIKRVPVVRDGRVIGIVSREDLLRALAGSLDHQPVSKAHTTSHGFLSGAFAAIDNRFHHDHDHAAPAEPRETPEPELTATGFRNLVVGFEHQKTERQLEAHQDAMQLRRGKVKQLIDLHFSDEAWRSTLRQAHEAAERGETEFMLLQFPSDLCSDGGRAINAPLPDWPKTLRGEAAEIYLRWEHDLKPRGFSLAARVLDFPGGMPGDVGLFLAWGK